ncbi:MAG: hypothetical protein AB1489_22325 [Acidobacteriota bacterium]
MQRLIFLTLLIIGLNGISLAQETNSLTGNWQIEFTLSNTKRIWTFQSMMKTDPSYGMGLFLIPAASTFGARSYAQAVWSQLTPTTFSLTSEVEFPVGNVGRQTGTLIFKGKFTSPKTISGLAIFISNQPDLTDPSGFLAMQGSFSGTINAKPTSDFSIGIEPIVQKISPSSPATLVISTSAINDFRTPIFLNVAVLPDDGNIRVFSPVDEVMPGDNAVITVETADRTSINRYALLVIGVAGQVSHTTMAGLIFELADFTLRINPPMLIVTRGQSGIIRVDIDRSDGFAGNVVVFPSPLKGLKISPIEQSSTGVSVSFEFIVKKGAPIGAHQLRFIGYDDAGRARSVMLTIVIR